MNFFQRRKARKELKQTIHHARTFKVSHEDIMPGEDVAELAGAIAVAERAYADNADDALGTAEEKLSECLGKLDPPKSLAGWRENFDVLVVAIGVAMAFRAYFYQPFKIPTGSMQPTLYGIHTETLPPERQGWSDCQPFRFAKWLMTGETFKVVRAAATGTLSFGQSNASKKPGYTPVIVAGIPHYVPNDVVKIDREARTVTIDGSGFTYGSHVREGDVIWSGKVISGDFVFVNRWIWNFRYPRRGEVMVFSTTGINGLTQGTHYIKRMMGLPKETLQVKAPYLYANGKKVTEPDKVAQIAAREKMAPWAPAYAGFNPAGSVLADENARITLGASQYFAMGDNSFNSFDSRYWGPVPEYNLLGPATVVYWPFTSPRFGWIR
jgi:signal peptidase I